MRCVEFEGQNLMLGPPPGTPRGECGALPAYVAPDHKTIASAWKPTPEEIAALSDGGHVILTVYGGGHPPVAMHVQKMTELP